MELELRGKSVVVTGGGSNIGRAIVLGFAAEGANITIGDIDAAQAARVAEQALRQGASGVEVVKTDVTRFEDANAMIQAGAKRFGAVDVLVNNVGWDQLGFFAQSAPDFWHKVIQINYVGLLNCARAALDVMIPAGRGSIVAISSDASRQGEAREAVYGGAKAAVNSFMKSLARENGRYGIRCNMVCPGVTMPESADEVGSNSMWSGNKTAFTPDQMDKIAKSLPLKRLGHASDIAHAVLFFASSRASGFVTGQTLSVSGGYSMVG